MDVVVARRGVRQHGGTNGGDTDKGSGYVASFNKLQLGIFVGYCIIIKI